MAYPGRKPYNSDAQETVKWTRPTISVPSGSKKGLPKANQDDRDQAQMASNQDTVSFTRPTINLQNVRANLKSTAEGNQNKPKRRISREDNVKSQDLEYLEKYSYRETEACNKEPGCDNREASVCAGRPTINLQGKFSQEKSKDGPAFLGPIASDNYASLADRAQPAPMEHSSSWITKPKGSHGLQTDQQKMSPQRYGSQNRSAIEVNPCDMMSQQQQPRRQGGEITFTIPTKEANTKSQQQEYQQYGSEDDCFGSRLPQQHHANNDDSMSWTRPTININPNRHNAQVQQTREKEQNLVTSKPVKPIPKPRRKSSKKGGSNVSQERTPQQYSSNERDVPQNRQSFDAVPSHPKFGRQDGITESQNSQGSQDGDSITWTRPTIDVKPSNLRQYGRQNGVDQPSMSSQNGSQDGDSVSWTRPTIDLGGSYPANVDQPTTDVRGSHDTDPSDPSDSFGTRDEQNEDFLVLDINALGEHEHDDLVDYLMSTSVKKPMQRQDSVTEIVAADLARIQGLALFDRKGVVVREVDEGQPCLRCGDNCPGFISHQWRNICVNCKCARDVHDVYHDGFVNIWDRLGWEVPKEYGPQSEEVAHGYGFSWVPPGVSMEKVEEYMEQLDNHKIPKLDTDGERYREIQLIHQLPKQDLSEEFCKHLKSTNHRKAFQDFCNARDTESMGIGSIKEYVKEESKCARSNCGSFIEPGDMAVMAPKLSEDLSWHPACFVCGACEELLVDLHYCHKDGQIFCERHYAELERPRCSACDELIFSGEYTKAMDQDWHSGHFCCWNCDLSLTGHRYILRDEHPFCIKCYENLFANICEECKLPIGTDSKDLSYKDKHWHEKCFKCMDCQKSLVDQPFASKDEKLYCADCHDNNFAPRCDGCGNVFKAGMKKFEFRGKQWHEECFICFACRQPIGNKRFIPRDHEFVCVPCYEEQFAQRCAKCNGVINKGGITYKGTPFHRDCFTCCNCSRILAGEKFTSRDERPYCADCFGELFAKKCCRCTKPITGLGGTKFISFDERHWHSDCFGCYKCGVSLVGRGFLTCGEDVVCPECGKTM